MTGGLDKVKAGMDTVVDELGPVHPVLLLEVGVEARLNVVHDGLPAVVVVDEVTKARRVNDSEAESHAALLDV